MLPHYLNFTAGEDIWVQIVIWAIWIAGLLVFVWNFPQWVKNTVMPLLRASKEDKND